MRSKSLSRTHFSHTPLKLTWVHNDLLFHERFEYHAFSDFGDNIMAAPLRALLDYSKILNELRFLIKADFKDLLCSLQKPDKQKVEKNNWMLHWFFLGDEVSCWSNAAGAASPEEKRRKELFW